MPHSTQWPQWLAACSLALCSVMPAAAQEASTSTWPSKTITWVVPFPPGGAMDVMARTLGDQLGRDLGQTVVVDNRPGAGGNIGAQHVAKQAPDGHTLMITSIGMATNPHLYSQLAYDPTKDFAPVTLLAVVPNVLVVRADNEDLSSVNQLIAKAKADPGSLSYASAGNGTSIHLAGANFTHLTGTDLLHVPYRGSSPAVADLLGGQVDMMFDSITSAKPYIEAGNLRALGLTTTQHSSALPQVPTLAEAGVSGYEVSPWFAVFVPAATPQATITRIHDAISQAMDNDQVKTRFASIGAEPIVSSPAQMAEHLDKETQRWGEIIRAAEIRLD